MATITHQVSPLTGEHIYIIDDDTDDIFIVPAYIPPEQEHQLRFRYHAWVEKHLAKQKERADAGQPRR